MPRKDAERRLISVKDCVNQAKISLECYVQSREEELLKAVRRGGDENIETAASFKVRRRTENIQEWKERPLYKQFMRQGEEQRSEDLVKRRKAQERNRRSYHCCTRSSNTILKLY